VMYDPRVAPIRFSSTIPSVSNHLYHWMDLPLPVRWWCARDHTGVCASNTGSW